MQREDRTEVLVVGAGPVGLFTALRLAGSGLRVQLIDQEPRTAGRSYACALHSRTLQLLNEEGLAGEAIERGQRIETVAFYEGAKRRAEVKLSRLPTQFPFVLVLPQSVLEDLLEKKLKERCGLRVHWNHRLAGLEMKDGAATATIEEMALAGKGYIAPSFEMEVKKRWRPARISWWAPMGRIPRCASGSASPGSRRASRSFSQFMNWKRRPNCRRK